jgi:hypothetical protein
MAQKVGCGVDHAHLHVLPVTRNLIADIPRVSDVHLKWEYASGLNSIRSFLESSSPYLYVEQDGHAFIADATEAPSQLFRRVVAYQAGMPSMFNWREHPMAQKVMQTARAVQDFLAPHNHHFASSASRAL